MSCANSLLMDNTNSFSSLADTSMCAMEELKGRKGKGGRKGAIGRVIGGQSKGKPPDPKT